LPLAKYRCDEPEGLVASAEQIALAICLVFLWHRSRKGRFAGDPFGFGPDCVEKICLICRQLVRTVFDGPGDDTYCL